MKHKKTKSTIEITHENGHLNCKLTFKPMAAPNAPMTPDQQAAKVALEAIIKLAKDES